LAQTLSNDHKKMRRASRAVVLSELLSTNDPDDELAALMLLRRWRTLELQQLAALGIAAGAALIPPPREAPPYIP